MNIEYIRASSMSTYLDCPFKYWLEYSLGLGSQAGKKALMGTIIHHVMELLAKVKKTKHHLLNDKYCDPEYLLGICWDRHCDENAHLFKFEPEDYKFCQKTLKQILATKWHPFNFDVKHTELQFELEVQIPGFTTQIGQPCKLRGTIDLIVQDGDMLRVIDYKTGIRSNWIGGGTKEYPDFLKDIQLQVYDIALKTLFPDVKCIMLTIHFVRDGGPFTVTFTNDDRRKAVERLRRNFNRIKADQNPKRLKDDRSRAKEFFKCKHVCSWGKTKAKNGQSLCDTYFKMMRDQGIEKAGKTIYQLTVEGKTSEASRRNDYSHKNIRKQVITESKLYE